MFNRTGITKITGSAPVQILFDVEHQMSVPVKVAAASENYVTENGRKIVKAGTPLAGDITTRNTAFTTTNTNTAVGILLHDVDITDGAANATMLLWGFVNLSRLGTSTAALVTAAVKTALKGSVYFLKD